MRTWKKRTIAMTALMSISAAAMGATSSPLSRQDISFLKDASELGRAEIQEASLATSRGTTDSIRQFANRMITDHSANNNQLTQIAGQYNVRIPMSLNRTHSADRTALSTMYGNQFDTQYLRNQVKDHQRALTVFQQEASSGQNADVRNLASQTVPTIQDHLRMAQDLLKSSEGNMYLHRQIPHRHGFRW
jgi:putative membrane protein